MNEKEILSSLQRSINEAPIDILDKIKNKNVVKMMKHDDITRQEKNRFIKPIISFASVAAVFMIILFNVQLLRAPENLVYLDVNPGIQITTNRKDKVIDLKGINQEAVKLLEDVDYKGREINDVTNEILDLLLNNSYIENKNELMLLSVFNKDREKGRAEADRLNELIHNKLDHMEYSPIVLIQALEESGTVEEFAKKYNISIGKMTFIRNMIILNPDLRTEDLVGLSLRELVEISQATGIDIERIIESSDIERISKPKEVESEAETQPALIGETRAREIALGRVNGLITDFELDWDDGKPEYEIEIISGEYEYKIEIHGYTGEILDVDRDEIDDDDD